MTKVVVVLSGGQDSTTCLAWAVAQGFEVVAVTFDYGQRHAREIQASRDVAKLCKVALHEIVTLGPILKGTSPLTDPSQSLETYTDYQSMDAIIGDRVEKTFVPMRNALFLTIAANRAVVAGATAIITGVCEADNANYPDCRQEFIAYQQMAINSALGYDQGDERYLRILTPLISLTKAGSIKLMKVMGGMPLLSFTHTAYDGQYPPTGNDHASVLRAQGFLEANEPDPLVVRAYFEGQMELPITPNYSGDLAELYDGILELKGRLVA